MTSFFNAQSVASLLEENGCKCSIDESMKLHTSFKIGGNAKLFISVGDEQALKKALFVLKANSVPYEIVGCGSNLLVSDAGISGAVIHLDGEFKSIRKDGDKIICGAAAPLYSLCNFAKNNSLSGLEFAYGIPGSAGGAVYMNAGAYGGEMKDVVLSCTHIDENGEIGVFGADELDFSYRHSVYSNTKFIILSAELQLIPGEKESISASMEEFMRRRKDKQPLEFPSAGSVFKRPEGNFAGALIEKSGLKGKQIGGAQVSEKHAGFIVNRGNATCEDVKNLVSLIQKTVMEKFGVSLECEVKSL